MGLKQLLIDTDEGLFGYVNGVPQQPNGRPFTQRTLDYGDNEPLVVKGLPGVEQETNSNVDLINQVTDNFTRGGVVGATTRALTDAKRLGKFLVNPSGLSFLATNFALHKTNNENIISPTNRNFSGFGSFVSSIVSFTGTRFRKDGFIDLAFENGYNYTPTGVTKYEFLAREFARNDIEDTSDHTLLGTLFNLKNGPDPSIIKQYNGGPHSTFGIGTTTIKRYKQNPYGGFYQTGLEYLPTFNEDFNSKHLGSHNAPISDNILDFREVKRTRFDNQPLPYTQVSRTRRKIYRMGDPGILIGNTAPDNNGINYHAYNIDTVDQLTAARIFKREDISEPKFFKDYIKFRIAVVDTENPLSDKVMLFRAFLDNINDNYTGNWNGFKYNGRAEKFYIYEGFDRQIQFNFKIHAQSRWEMKPLWQKLNYLVAQTAPEYKNRRMRGVFSRLTIGDWMNEIPGFFTAVNLAWNSAYPWEIRHEGQPGGVDEAMNEYPHILEVQCSFTPVHNFTPNNAPCAPFILPEINVNRERQWGKTDEFIPEGPAECLNFAQTEEEARIDFNAPTDLESIQPLNPSEVPNPIERPGLQPINLVNPPRRLSIPPNTLNNQPIVPPDIDEFTNNIKNTLDLLSETGLPNP